ncbi:amino acid ABC transporter permease [Rhizobium miluonense]|uniref:Polar amino acid transport system permease protein n=1 Tax=Rhizobium miluonense TaxID=411945 RepID=A0A1C3X073_9HYPH|nr:ABC transporter permease subunit [Rhizobium miluonense]SCB45526.1 polar amino acid transport system permease protein [Rhizobium miluonense]
MTFDFSFAIQIIPLVLKGIGNTILVGIASFIGATVLGLIWELIRRSNRYARPVMQFIIDCLRSTPVIVHLYFLFFVLPYYEIVLPAMFVGIFGLSIYFSGYISEVFKAGFDTVPRGQSEAAQSLGLGGADIFRFVIAPQMIRNVAAPLGSYSVSILKSTPYLSIIAVPEMLGSAFDVASDTYRYAEPMFVAGILFLALSLLMVAGISYVERRLGLTHAHA